MKRYLSLLLAMLMLLAPCGAQASWLFGDWGSYDDSYYDEETGKINKELVRKIDEEMISAKDDELDKIYLYIKNSPKIIQDFRG